MANPTPEQMLNLIVKQWKEYCLEQNEEQEDLLFELMAEIQEQGDNQLWWQLITQLIAASPDDQEILEKIATGSLEDFLHNKERVQDYQNQIFEEIQNNKKFEHCIQKVWFATNKEYPAGFLEQLGKLTKITVLKA